MWRSFHQSEVILSYLGPRRRRVDQVSWGTMLAEAQNELILGHWWQLSGDRPHGRVRLPRLPSHRRVAWMRLDPKLRGLE